MFFSKKNKLLKIVAYSGLFVLIPVISWADNENESQSKSNESSANVRVSGASLKQGMGISGAAQKVTITHSELKKSLGVNKTAPRATQFEEISEADQAEDLFKDATPIK
jgi:hypothetical protein